MHDWLTGMRGGERVLELLCRLLPRAEVFTLVHVPGSVSSTIEDRPVHTAPVDRWPLAHRKHQVYLPLLPMMVEGFDLAGFDLVISTSHCVAKGALAPPETPHLCYCFSPMRYLYDQGPAYRAAVPALLRPVFDLVVHQLRIWDAASAGRPDRFVAISAHTAARIQRAYRRPAEVLFPPVDLAAFPKAAGPPGDALLVLSALVPYKRIDLAVRAAGLTGRRLLVAGGGPELGRLQAMAGPGVEFLGRVADEDRAPLLARCRALLFPGEEDFGIVPLEANAVGRPVVGYARGGLAETQVDGETAVLFPEQSVEAMAAAITRAEQVAWDPDRIRARAERFSEQAFLAAFAELIERCVAEKRSGPA